MTTQIHTATYAGKCYSQAKTQWAETLNTNASALDKLLQKHGTMQALIQAEFQKQQQRHQLTTTFLCGSAKAWKMPTVKDALIIDFLDEGNRFEFVIEFDNNRYHSITISKGDTAGEVANALIDAAEKMRSAER